MLDELAFVAGPAPGAEPLVVRPSAVTVLVGPNNCGKSLALQELEGLLRRRSADLRCSFNELSLGPADDVRFSAQAHEPQR